MTAVDSHTGMGARFGGRTAVVTGAGSGIGRETAMSFAAEGATVVVADIAGGAETVAAITAAGLSALSVPTDVSDAAAVEALMATAVDRTGRLDVVHNNAFWAPLYTPLADTTWSSGTRRSPSP